jgi:hypothetical protein
MATSATVDGKSLTLRIDTTSTTVVIENLTSNDLEMSQDLRETTSKASGKFKEYQPTFADLTFSAEGLKPKLPTEDLKDILVDGTSLYWEWGTGVSGEEKITGRGYITGYSESASNGENATFSVDIQNTGDPTFSTYSA